MTHEIVCYATPTRAHQRRADTGIVTAHPAELPLLSRALFLCVQWSAYSAARIAEWRRRARSRRDLMTLGDRDLWDMHLTRCDAWYEASKPFWRE
jgi:uncharacterized protein YjiS (DUF1127 family)